MQTKDTNTDELIADARADNWVDRYAPRALKPYLKLARYDRPIGIWLLFWPCAMSVGLAAVAAPMNPFQWGHIILFLIGAAAMRGAGCTFNDIVDRNIDGKVARTRLRPIPSGQVNVKQAVAFMIAQCLVGLVVLLQFNSFTIWLGISSLGLVAIYPFMKRVTYWPQLFLGLCFSWGALMGWASVFDQLFMPPVALYLACILWVIGYDTIYAIQDMEDDALIGVKSTARLFGRHSRLMVTVCYALAFALFIYAGLSASADRIFLFASIPAGLILLWQVATLNPDDGKNCLMRFKANRFFGLAFTIALWVEWYF